MPLPPTPQPHPTKSPTTDGQGDGGEETSQVEHPDISPVDAQEEVTTPPPAQVGKKSTLLGPDIPNQVPGGSTDVKQTRGISVRGKNLMDIFRNKNTPENKTASIKKKSRMKRTKEKQTEPAADIRRFLVSTEKPTISKQSGSNITVEDNIRKW